MAKRWHGALPHPLVPGTDQGAEIGRRRHPRRRGASTIGSALTSPSRPSGRLGRDEHGQNVTLAGQKRRASGTGYRLARTRGQEESADLVRVFGGPPLGRTGLAPSPTCTLAKLGGVPATKVVAASCG